MGKSTIANAILYALGGEGMLSPKWRLPLKYCLYDYLLTDQGEKIPVLDSSITVELVNGRGQELSVRRFVSSENVKRDLVQLWDGRVLSEPSGARRRGDAFLRTPGSASRPDGFHTQLAEFVGWELPSVVRYDGTTSPLYLQLLFPFFFVEQQVGWAGVRANVPRFLQVRDPGRRAVEFLLALDANERSQRREALRSEEARLKQEWTKCIAQFRGSTRTDPVRIRELPDYPITSWPPSPPPAVELYDEEQWKDIGAVTVSLQARLAELKEREIPTVEAVAEETEQRLAELEAEHRRLAASHGALVRDVEADASDLERIDARLASLQVDRQRHQDAEKIAALGGSPATDLEDGRCPTCDQDWPIDLLGGQRDGEPIMTISEHLELIEQEERSLKALRKGAEATLADLASREQALKASLMEMRADIRAHRQTLLSDARGPSAAAIREQLLVEDRIRRAEGLRGEMTGLLDELEPLSLEYRKVKAELRDLEESDLSDHDRNRLNEFGRNFLGQLAEYGFRSLDGVTVSEETYLPERDGFDLTHEVSASDTIRLIWAYLLSLMEAGAEETNHPGFLILDEPGQQEVEEESLRSFLNRAATARERHQQVLVTVTREVSQADREELADAQVVDFGRRQHVLQPLDD
jgi:hypothetical protein